MSAHGPVHTPSKGRAGRDFPFPLAIQGHWPGTLADTPELLSSLGRVSVSLGPKLCRNSSGPRGCCPSRPLVGTGSIAGVTQPSIHAKSEAAEKWEEQAEARECSGGRRGP